MAELDRINARADIVRRVARLFDDGIGNTDPHIDHKARVFERVMRDLMTGFEPVEWRIADQKAEQAEYDAWRSQYPA